MTGFKQIIYVRSIHWPGIGIRILRVSKRGSYGPDKAVEGVPSAQGNGGSKMCPPNLISQIVTSRLNI